jgi:hypothetical protein
MQVSKQIAAPIETVWEILIDSQLWPLWGPSVSAVDFPPRYLTAGAQGRVRIIVGLWAGFEVTSFEPPYYWHWQVAGRAATGHRLTELSPGHCRLSFELPFVAFPYAAICRLAANNVARLAEEKVATANDQGG